MASKFPWRFIRATNRRRGHTAYQKVFEHLVNQPLPDAAERNMILASGTRVAGGKLRRKLHQARSRHASAKLSERLCHASPVSSAQPEPLSSFGTATQVQPHASSSVKLRAAA